MRTPLFILYLMATDWLRRGCRPATMVGKLIQCTSDYPSSERLRIPSPAGHGRFEHGYTLPLMQNNL